MSESSRSEKKTTVLKNMSCTFLEKGKHYCFTDENSPSFMIVSYGNGRKVVINPDAKMEHLRSFFHERLETDYLQDFVDHFKNIVKKERENYEDERATPSKFTKNRQTRLQRLDLMRKPEKNPKILNTMLHKSELDRVCDSNYRVNPKNSISIYYFFEKFTHFSSFFDDFWSVDRLF